MEGGFSEESSSDKKSCWLGRSHLYPHLLNNMCPGKRLPILFAFLLILLIFYLPQPPIFPIAPCEPLKPLSRLQDLAEVWRQSEQICGEIGASLRTLYQVEQEEAGRLVLPKPLLERGLKYYYTKNRGSVIYVINCTVQKVLGVFNPLSPARPGAAVGWTWFGSPARCH